MIENSNNFNKIIQEVVDTIDISNLKKEISYYEIEAEKFNSKKIPHITDFKLITSTFSKLTLFILCLILINIDDIYFYGYYIVNQVTIFIILIFIFQHLRLQEIIEMFLSIFNRKKRLPFQKPYKKNNFILYFDLALKTVLAFFLISLGFVNSFQSYILALIDKPIWDQPDQKNIFFSSFVIIGFIILLTETDEIYQRAIGNKENKLIPYEKNIYELYQTVEEPRKELLEVQQIKQSNKRIINLSKYGSFAFRKIYQYPIIGKSFDSSKKSYVYTFMNNYPNRYLEWSINEFGINNYKIRAVDYSFKTISLFSINILFYITQVLYVINLLAYTIINSYIGLRPLLRAIFTIVLLLILLQSIIYLIIEFIQMLQITNQYHDVKEIMIKSLNERIIRLNKLKLDDEINKDIEKITTIIELQNHLKETKFKIERQGLIPSSDFRKIKEFYSVLGMIYATGYAIFNLIRSSGLLGGDIFDVDIEISNSEKTSILIILFSLFLIVQLSSFIKRSDNSSKNI
ncbi:MAG: hypothetical protein GPJ54_15760 [Candidatus Heimdallarchaeota archaeon]|nr:hypothetical protein [Candidatus Heimdallarchaeota archaeon]